MNTWSVICNHISYPSWSMPIVCDALAWPGIQFQFWIRWVGPRRAISVKDWHGNVDRLGHVANLARLALQQFAGVSVLGRISPALVQPTSGLDSDRFSVLRPRCVLGPWRAECIYRCVMDLGTCTGVRDVESDVVVRLTPGDNSESI